MKEKMRKTQSSGKIFKNAFSLQSEKARAAALFEKSAPKGEWLTKRHLLFVCVQWTDAAHSTGGPAKVAVISSALCGMVSGSSVGNTVTTGSVTIPKIIDALEAGGKGTITVAVACAMAGIVAGCITSTGLASKLISTIVTVSGGHAIIALALTMLCCIVLGMGVPTTANYCIMAATCAPILIDGRIGIPVVCAHFFVFYFGIVADITPPVALAAYAGSAIAKAPPMKTAFNASRLAIAAFIVPYIFAFNNAMLFIDTNVFEVVQVCLTSCIGMFGIAAGIEGYMLKEMNPVQRILSVLGGLMLIYPGTITDVCGVLVVVLVGVWQQLQKRKAAAV